MSTVLAIDQSTSATKAVVFDKAGRVLGKVSREHRQIYPQPGWVEHDAEEIWRNVLAVIGDLASGNRLDGVGCLSLTNQRETIVVFERGTGKPLHPAIVWQCRRGDAICRELEAAGRGDLVRSRTGLKLDTYFSGSKLKWLTREFPEIRQRLENGEALVGTIDTYLVYRLTGGKVFATDHTNASRTLLYDIRELRWDQELCDLFGVPLQALPEVRESFARFGETNADGALMESVPICGVMGDSQASLFGQHCHEPGMAKATFGSGTSILLNVGEHLPVAPEGAVSALAWVWRGRPVYALEGIITYSSATLSWLKDQMGLITDANETEALAGAVEDNGGVYLVPAFSGLSAPYWNGEARAAILGMTAHTRREHVVRAALESIAYQVRDVLEMMAGEGGIVPRLLHVDGGPTRNEFLMQFIADVAGVELILSDVPESSALGAAMAGWIGLGRYQSPSELTEPAALRRYRPRMDEARRRSLCAGWADAVARVA